jgi:hypothetical protein
MSFNEWMTALGQSIVPSRRLIHAPDNPGTRIEPPRTVDRMQRNGMFGIPIASLLNSQGLADFNQARRVYEEDTDSMRVNSPTWRPHSPFADGGLSSTATNWSGTTLVGSEEASLSGETLIREVSSNSETVPLVRRQYQPAQFLFGSEDELSEEGENVVRMLETEIEIKEANDEFMDEVTLRMRGRRGGGL